MRNQRATGRPEASPPARRALPRLAVGLALAATLLLHSACRRETPDGTFTLQPGDVWIRDITIASAEREAPLPDAHVVVRDGRIAWIGTAPPRGGAEAVTIVAAPGKYLTPGLIDSHVHLAGVPGMMPEQEAAQPALVEAYFAQLPRSYLYFGFTTVVDLNIVDRRPIERLRATEIAPTVFDCGSALPLANGYPMNFLPPAVRFEIFPNFLDDPQQRGAIPARFAPADHSPAAVVARVAASGGRCVKSFYEPGFGPDAGTLPVPTLDLMRGVRDASRQHGLPLLLHANSLRAYRFAAEARPDVIVHGLWNWGDDEAADPAPTDGVRQVLAATRQNGTAMMPTARVAGGLADLFNPSFLDDPQLPHVLPAELIAWYRRDEGQWFARETGRGFPSPERAREIFTGIQARAERAAEAFARDGGRILFGSDTPSGPTYANPPGYNGYLELRNLERTGLSPRQLLAAATIENAKQFGLAADYGTIEPGKVASLLLLSADPLTSTAAFDRIDTIIVRGRVVPRATLAATSR